MYEARLRRLLLGFYVLLGVIGVRAFALQVLDAEVEPGKSWASLAGKSHAFVVHPRRGEIFWADGTRMAWNVPTYGLEILWGEVDHRIVPTLEELRAAYPPGLSEARRASLETRLLRIGPKLLEPRKDSRPQHRWICSVCATQLASGGAPEKPCAECGAREWEEVPPLTALDLAIVLESDVHSIHAALIAAMARWEMSQHWRSHALLARIPDSASADIALRRDVFAGFETLARNGRDVDPLARTIVGGTRLPDRDDLDRLTDPKRAARGLHVFVPAAVYPSLVGSSLLERHHDELLRGVPGRSERLRRRENDFAEEIRVLRPVVDGPDLRTTLRRDVQAMALDIVAAAPEGGHGAAVVIDVRTGAVIALASTERDALDHARSHVTPGSVYKLVTAIALLEAGHSPDETMFCAGDARIAAGGRYACSHKAGDGDIALHSAFVRSCNGYFAQQAVAVGADALAAAAERLGIGQRPLVDALGWRGTSPAGLEHSSPEKDREHWRPWDVSQIGIGQGAASASPLQVAVAYARIASGGRVVRPWLLERDRPDPAAIPVDPVLARWAPLLRDAAYGVVHDADDHGTAAEQPALVAVGAAGKTGTAEVGVKGSFLNNASFVGYAPYDDPRYCAIVVFERLPERRFGAAEAGEPVARLLAEALRE